MSCELPVKPGVHLFSVQGDSWVRIFSSCSLLFKVSLVACDAISLIEAFGSTVSRTQGLPYWKRCRDSHWEFEKEDELLKVTQRVKLDGPQSVLLLSSVGAYLFMCVQGMHVCFMCEHVCMCMESRGQPLGSFPRHHPPSVGRQASHWPGTRP